VFFTISNNASLKGFDGLSSLSTVLTFGLPFVNRLTITNNAKLKNLDGLSGLRVFSQDMAERTFINVTKNPSLTRCNGLYPYLAGGGLNVTLAENGAGCTVEDILASSDEPLMMVSDQNESATSRLIMSDGQNAYQSKSDISVYPVPVGTALHLEIDDRAGKDARVTISNVQGMIVYSGLYSKSSTIATVNLQSGVYFLQVVGKKGYREVVRFIKK
jgi:hypothetical protein